jgi:hypothetical protein
VLEHGSAMAQFTIEYRMSHVLPYGLRTCLDQLVSQPGLASFFDTFDLDAHLHTPLQCTAAMHTFDTPLQYTPLIHNNTTYRCGLPMLLFNPGKTKGHPFATRYLALSPNRPNHRVKENPNMDIPLKPMIRDNLKPNVEMDCGAREADNDEGNVSNSAPEAHIRHTLWPSFLPRYENPSVQVTLVALVSFLCPGMWNALNGLGGGGLVDAKPANNANVALYSTFAVVGFFAGIVTNKLGVRLTLSLGGFGYTLYSSSLLCYKHTENAGFLIFAGLQLGLCAGLFWTAQGMVMLSYPTEEAKGKYIAWSWMIYNMGAVIGSAVSASCWPCPENCS